MSTGLILFAHGARDPRWAAPFETVLQRLRTQRPSVPLRLAFLELMPPTLLEAGAELVALGCTHVAVLPLFLGSGGHVRKDLPLLLDGLRTAHPDLVVALHPAIGEQDAVIAAIVDVAARALDTLDRST